MRIGHGFAAMIVAGAVCFPALAQETESFVDFCRQRDELPRAEALLGKLGLTAARPAPPPPPSIERFEEFPVEPRPAPSAEITDSGKGKGGCRRVRRLRIGRGAKNKPPAEYKREGETETERTHGIYCSERAAGDNGAFGGLKNWLRKELAALRRGAE